MLRRNLKLFINSSKCISSKTGILNVSVHVRLSLMKGRLQFWCQPCFTSLMRFSSSVPAMKNRKKHDKDFFNLNGKKKDKAQSADRRQAKNKLSRRSQYDMKKQNEDQDYEKTLGDVLTIRQIPKLDPVTESERKDVLRPALQKFLVLQKLSTFIEKPNVRQVAYDNGIQDDAMYQKIYQSFRTYIRDNFDNLPLDLCVILHDITGPAQVSEDALIPAFLRHSYKCFPSLQFIDDMKSRSNLTLPSNWYAGARDMNRKVIFHAGPTNSGKTHKALQRFKEAKSGIFCGPLRLLAQEVFKRMNDQGVPCDLITGEEKQIVDKDGNLANHRACTTEIACTNTHFEVAVIDEIQMLQDPERGGAWTRVLLGLCADEIHVCGEPRAISLVRKLMEITGDELEVHEYDRLTKLSMCNTALESLQNVQPGDCIVAFNKQIIYSILLEFEKLNIDAAVIYGSLPPGVKRAQAAIFNDPNHPCKVLVATDAIGMGINLNIKRIIFYGIRTFDGSFISTPMALQIAGRAGRYGTVYADGLYTCYKNSDYQKLKEITSNPPNDIERAGLYPSVEQMDEFSFHLETNKITEVLDVFYAIAKLDKENYFLCHMGSFKELCQLVDPINLSLREKYVFCCAPVTSKESLVSTVFVMFARMVSRGHVVTVDLLMSKLNFPLEKPKTMQEQKRLENIYECFDLYMWLSYRFSDLFPDQSEVIIVKEELESIIRHGIQNLTFLAKTVTSEKKKK